MATNLFSIASATRNVANAQAAAAKPDGSITTMDGLQYITASARTGALSATNDLGVDGLRPYGAATPIHYGALGDDVSGTDDTAAAQAAIDNNGYVLFERRYTYRISKLNIPAGKMIDGQGEGTIRQIGSENAIITFSGKNAGVEGLKIIGDDSVASVGVYGDTDQGRVINCWFQNIGGPAIQTGSNTDNWIILGNHIQTAMQYGLYSERLGLIDLDGNRCFVSDNFVSATRANLSSLNKYIVGIHLKGAGHLGNGNHIEECDQGVYATGTGRHNMGFALRRIWAEGLVLVSDYNYFDVVIHDAGIQADDFYDGISELSGSQHNRVKGVITATVSDRVRYGVYSAETTSPLQWEGVIEGARTGDTSGVSSGGALTGSSLEINSGANNQAARFISTDPSVSLSLEDDTTTGEGYVGIKATGDNLKLRAGNADIAEYDANGLVSQLVVNVGTANIAARFQSDDAACSISLEDDTTTGVGYVGIKATGDSLSFRAGNADKLNLDGSGNTSIGTTSVPASATNSLTINNGIAPSASVTNAAILFVQSGELRVRDAAGNVTVLSPHNFDLIPGGASDELAWSYRSEKNGRAINVDMLKAIRLLEELSGEQLVYEG